MSFIPGALAVVAAVMALLARRLEHMGVLVGLVAGLLAVDLLGRGDPGAATALIAGGGIMAAVVLVAVAVIEVDARPGRRLQPWKLLLLAPLVVAAGLWQPEGAGVRGGDVSVRTGDGAVPGAILVLGLTGLAIPLLVRRGPTAPPGSDR